jgi:hypothetical protein
MQVQGRGISAVAADTEDEARILTRVARLSARLAHRLADRDAILLVENLTDEEWSTLETAAMLVLLREGAETASAVFAHAYAEARAELMGLETHATSEEPVGEPKPGRRRATTDMMRTLAKPR